MPYNWWTIRKQRPVTPGEAWTWANRPLYTAHRSLRWDSGFLHAYLLLPLKSFKPQLLFKFAQHWEVSGTPRTKKVAECQRTGAKKTMREATSLLPSMGCNFLCGPPSPSHPQSLPSPVLAPQVSA